GQGPTYSRTCTPGAVDSVSASVLTPTGASFVSSTVAKPVTSAGAGAASRAGGAVTTTSGSFSSPRATTAVSATGAHAVRRRGLIPSSFPAEGRSLASSGPVFWLGDHPRPVPSRPASGAVATTGVVPPHSCGAAGASHPLPVPVEVGRSYRSRTPPVKRANP